MFLLKEEVPKNCNECIFFTYEADYPDHCLINTDIEGYGNYENALNSKRRPKNCPIIPIKEEDKQPPEKDKE